MISFPKNAQSFSCSNSLLNSLSVSLNWPSFILELNKTLGSKNEDGTKTRTFLFLLPTSPESLRYSLDTPLPASFSFSVLREKGMDPHSFGASSELIPVEQLMLCCYLFYLIPYKPSKKGKYGYTLDFLLYNTM